MEGKSILSSPAVVSPTLDIGRAYSARDAAAILGIVTSVLNERVREGLMWTRKTGQVGKRESCS